MAERQQGANQPLPVGMAAQECIALADMIQLELGRKTTDVIDQLTNTDFQGDFFKIGDTVQVVAINPNSIKVVEGDKDDLRPTLNTLAFAANTMVIDSERKFGFQIKDLERIEDKWNHESAAHALAARKMREADARGVLQLIVKNNQIRTIGDATHPIDLTLNNAQPAERGMFKLVNRMKSELKKVGALDTAGQYTFGANKTVQQRGTASLFVPPALYRELLNSQTTRVDDVIEDVIRDGKYEKYLGFLLNETPELDGEEPTAIKAVKDIQPADETKPRIGVVVMGTKNAVTRATKVLPPEKMRDYVHFADNYYGREIYGQMVACADAVIIAYVEIPDDGLTVNGPAATEKDAVLFTHYDYEDPVATDETGRFLANEGYANSEGVTIAQVEGLTTELQGKATATHVHDVTSTFAYNADTPADSTVTNEVGAPEEPQGE